MEKLRTSSLDVQEERLLWEGLAAACSPPLRRLGAFLLVGFTAFITLTTAIVLVYNVFGERQIEGQGVSVPHWVFYTTMGVCFALAILVFLVWLLRNLRSYDSFATMLRRNNLNPRRPTLNGLRAYSDHQLLALRSRYEKHRGKDEKTLELMFGFRRDDSFALAPLNTLPGTFEMNALRVEWESNLLLREETSVPEVSWWTEARNGFLPRQPNETRRLTYALRYTTDSVHELKRRYGYRTQQWHATVPEGKLFDALRDVEEARRIQSTLGRKPRHS
ncbi:MAG: hypothetical protein ACFB50_05580 [Rubrobacteraceae bacterium]